MYNITLVPSWRALASQSLSSVSLNTGDPTIESDPPFIEKKPVVLGSTLGLGQQGLARGRGKATRCVRRTFCVRWPVSRLFFLFGRGIGARKTGRTLVLLLAARLRTCALELLTQSQARFADVRSWNKNYILTLKWMNIYYKALKLFSWFTPFTSAFWFVPF